MTSSSGEGLRVTTSSAGENLAVHWGHSESRFSPLSLHASTASELALGLGDEEEDEDDSNPNIVLRQAWEDAAASGVLDKRLEPVHLFHGQGADEPRAFGARVCSVWCWIRCQGQDFDVMRDMSVSASV